MSTETLAVTAFALLLVVSALALSTLSRRAQVCASRFRVEELHRRAGLDESVHPTGCFYRGISFALLVDALLAVAVGGLLNPALPDLAPLGMTLAAALVAGRRVSRTQPSPVL